MTTYKPTVARYWCVTDLECTGFEPDGHEIIQIARVAVDKQIVSGLTGEATSIDIPFPKRLGTAGVSLETGGR